MFRNELKIGVNNMYDLCYQWKELNGYNLHVPYNLDLFMNLFNYHNCFTGKREGYLCNLQ